MSVEAFKIGCWNRNQVGWRTERRCAEGICSNMKRWTCVIGLKGMLFKVFSLAKKRKLKKGVSLFRNVKPVILREFITVRFTHSQENLGKQICVCFVKNY